MAEEHRCQAPEGHRLCANNCGLFGSPATMNLCSKCFTEQESSKSTIETALSSSSSSAAVPSPSPVPSTSSPPSPAAVESHAPFPVEIASSSATVSIIAAAITGASVQPNRCASCRKRVGLTGFKCRCGVTFCGTHRYPEKHACGFDFKTAGREEIARANPVIKAEKLRRI